jgi:hypothetical protein
MTVIVNVVLLAFHDRAIRFTAEVDPLTQFGAEL